MSEEWMLNVVEQMAGVGRLAVAGGLVLASGGNLSAREPGGSTFLITGAGTWLDRLDRSEFSQVGLDGGIFSSLEPSSEWKLHARIYQARADVTSVIHLHPQYALLVSALGKRIRFITQDHAYYVGSYGSTKYYTNGSDELADTAAEQMLDHNVVLMGNHGIAAAGGSVEAAYRIAVNFEEAAKATYRALLLGDEDTEFPAEELEKLIHR